MGYPPFAEYTFICYCKLRYRFHLSTLTHTLAGIWDHPLASHGLPEYIHICRLRRACYYNDVPHCHQVGQELAKSKSQKILEIRCYRNYWTLKMHNLTFFAVDCLMIFSAVDQHYNYRLPSPLALHAYMNCVNSNLPNIHNPRSRIEARLNGIHQYVSYERLANLVSPFV
jgi:hypothetical protein